ncbi:integrase [Paucibacter sp. KBW04]|nr:integrase [Paucibacter sp. KBW04]
MRPIFGPGTWDQVDLPTIKGYLKKRTAKTQANREMALLSIIWNWARGEGMTTLPWPAAGMEKSKWRNKEKPRRVKVDYDIFTPIYAEGDQILRDCMDLGSATAMRLTDCINILLPRGDVLRLEASKTGKEADYDLSLSKVLPGLLARRRKVDTNHLMLLSTADGKPVTLTMLRYRWDSARFTAACKIYAQAGLMVNYTEDQAEAYDMARRIRALYLRDMRKMAAQLSPNLKEASALLQHPNEAFTQKHYGGVTKLVTVR